MSITIVKTGQRVRASQTFTVSGTPTDPTTITAKVKDPSGNVSAYIYNTNVELVRDGTGLYHIDIITDEDAEWMVRFEGTGACVHVDEIAFRCRSAFV